MSTTASQQPRWRRLLPVLLALSLVAAACGGGGDDDDAGGGGGGGEAASGGGGGEVDPDGVLKIATALGANTTASTYDLVEMQSPASDIHMLVYDTLLRAQMDGSYEPGIASGATVVDPTTVAVTINEGIEFNDGSPLTPEDVQYSILRHRDAQNGGAFAAEMQEISDVTVAGQVVTITLKSPIAGIFYQLLGRGETMVESRAAIESGAHTNDSPVAAGPYMIESLQPDDSMVLVKNPGYFQADQIRIPRIEYINTPQADPQVVITALRSDAADLANNFPQDQLPSVEGLGLESKTEVSPSTLLWGQICKKNEPLSDVRVRQALNYALDRDALNEVIYDGKSKPQWGFWPEEHPFHNPEMTDYYERDIQKAKDLLEDAGVGDGFSFDVVNQPGITQTANEMIKEQWAEIGVTINLTPVQNLVEEFFVENKMQMFFFPLQRSGLDKVTRNLVLGSVGNVCQWDDPELNDLVAQLRAVPQSADSDEAVQLWHELEELTVTEAMNIYGVFGTTTNLWDGEKLGDVEFVPNFQGIPYLDIRDAFIKA